MWITTVFFTWSCALLCLLTVTTRCEYLIYFDFDRYALLLQWHLEKVPRVNVARLNLVSSNGRPNKVRIISKRLERLHHDDHVCGSTNRLSQMVITLPNSDLSIALTQAVQEFMTLMYLLLVFPTCLMSIACLSTMDLSHTLIHTSLNYSKSLSIISLRFDGKIDQGEEFIFRVTDINLYEGYPITNTIPGSLS